MHEGLPDRYPFQIFAMHPDPVLDHVRDEKEGDIGYYDRSPAGHVTSFAHLQAGISSAPAG
jgi:hypothetical protein